MEDALAVSRLQFALTVTYHYHFHMLTMGLAMLVWAGPRNLCRRCPKQEAPGLSAPGEARVV